MFIELLDNQFLLLYMQYNNMLLCYNINIVIKDWLNIWVNGITHESWVMIIKWREFDN